MTEEISAPHHKEGYVELEVDAKRLEGNLHVPQEARGVILFIHGSGSGRSDPRNLRVAEELRQASFATLLLNLLTRDELGGSLRDHLEARFDIPLLTRRVIMATQWLRREPLTKGLGIGYFATSTGGAAAVAAAIELGDIVRAIVSCDGRPDLVRDQLGRLQVPTRLIVGEGEAEAHFLNRQAFDAIATNEKDLLLIPGGTDRLEGPGERDEVARAATDWFSAHMHGIAGTARKARDSEPRQRKRKAA